MWVVIRDKQMFQITRKEPVIFKQCLHFIVHFSKCIYIVVFHLVCRILCTDDFVHSIDTLKDEKITRSEVSTVNQSVNTPGTRCVLNQIPRGASRNFCVSSEGIYSEFTFRRIVGCHSKNLSSCYSRYAIEFTASIENENY